MTENMILWKTSDAVSLDTLADEASPADLLAVVRRGVESGTIEGAEPDYEAAKRQIDHEYDDDLPMGNVKRIVDAAVGGRLLVDPPKEERQ